MSMLLFLSIGCSNISPPEWSGGGTRYASGTASFGSGEDTADTGDTAGSGGEEGAPVLLTGSAQYVENEASELHIEAGVGYTDDPDDVNGGTLYYTLLGDGATLEEGSRPCTTGIPDPLTEALIANGNITFEVGPVEADVEHELIVVVRDFPNNRSNEISVSVTGR